MPPDSTVAYINMQSRDGDSRHFCGMQSFVSGPLLFQFASFTAGIQNCPAGDVPVPAAGAGRGQLPAPPAPVTATSQGSARPSSAPWPPWPPWPLGPSRRARGAPPDCGPVHGPPPPPAAPARAGSPQGGRSSLGAAEGGRQRRRVGGGREAATAAFAGARSHRFWGHSRPFGGSLWFALPA